MCFGDSYHFSTVTLQIRRDDIEDEDYVESYVKHMKKRGIEIGKSQKQTIERDEVDMIKHVECCWLNNKISEYSCVIFIRTLTRMKKFMQRHELLMHN